MKGDTMEGYLENRVVVLEKALGEMLDLFEDDGDGYTIETRDGLAVVSDDVEDAVDHANAVLWDSEEEDE